MKNQSRPLPGKRSKRKILAEYMVTLIELAQMKQAVRTYAKLSSRGAQLARA